MVQCAPELQQPPRPSVQGTLEVAQEGMELPVVLGAGGRVATQPFEMQVAPKEQHTPPRELGHCGVGVGGGGYGRSGGRARDAASGRRGDSGDGGGGEAVKECGIRAYIHRRAVIPDRAATRFEVFVDEAELSVGTAFVWETCIFACDRQFLASIARELNDSTHIGGIWAVGIRRCSAGPPATVAVRPGNAAD
ncbi:hypothetical protein V493_04738 [Pseudogymnoascus sp. VKM F-4281 (FW-2241)]|nr:hypothetical protein V493_04738 [Pseudogymnoascus sp. VKM F-4281 (FW-2241)]